MTPDTMNEDRATALLATLGCVSDGESIWTRRERECAIDAYADTAFIACGKFSVDQLEALVWWMRNKLRPVKT
jgi:hypothetical protein